MGIRLRPNYMPVSSWTREDSEILTLVNAMFYLLTRKAKSGLSTRFFRREDFSILALDMGFSDDPIMRFLTYCRATNPTAKLVALKLEQANRVKWNPL